MLVARSHGGVRAEEVRDELHHAGVDEQEVRIVEDHRRAGHLGVARFHEVIEEALPDLVCLHVLAVLRDSWGCRGLLDRITVPARVHGHKRNERHPRLVPAQPLTKLNRTERRGLSRFRSTSTTLCQVPSIGSPPCTGTVTDGATMAGSTWSAPWPGEP